MTTEAWYGGTQMPRQGDNYKDVEFIRKGETTIRKGFFYDGKIMHNGRLHAMSEIEQWRFAVKEDKQC